MSKPKAKTRKAGPAKAGKSVGRSNAGLPRKPKSPLPALHLPSLDIGGLEPAMAADGKAPEVDFDLVYEDPNNPRTEVDPEALKTLAADIALRGILQPIVVRPAGKDGRYMIRFGARRRRAAEIAAETTGKRTVPVVVDDRADRDDYSQVAENFHREDLPPMDLARFIDGKLKQGAKPFEVAKRLRVDKSIITYHTALMGLPEPLMALYESGRCTSAKTLYELRNLYSAHKPEVAKFIAGTEEVTRAGVRALAKRLEERGAGEAVGPSNAKGGEGAAPPKKNTDSSSREVDPAQRTAGEGGRAVGPSNEPPAATIQGGSVGPSNAEKGAAGEHRGEGGAEGTGDVDAGKIRTPLLLAEYEGRAVTVQLYRRPPSPEKVYVLLGDGTGEVLADTAALSAWRLVDAAGQEGPSN